MSFGSTSAFVVFFLLFTAGEVYSGDGKGPEEVAHAKGQTSRTRHAIGAEDAAAAHIFNSRCVTCHREMGSRTFGGDGLPRPEDRDEVLRRIESKGAAMMPPADASEEETLTDDERKKLQAWLQAKKQSGTLVTDPKACYAQDPKKPVIRDSAAAAILAKACMGCHGAFDEPAFGDMPWTMVGKLGGGVVRKLHTPFLKSDGSLDFAQLGETKYMESKVPSLGFTSVDRVLNQIAGHYMPPRGLGELADKDRADILAWLNKMKSRESCDLVSAYAVQLEKPGNPLRISGFAKAAKSCDGGSMSWLPTYGQLAKFLTDSTPTKLGALKVKEGLCFWTSSYSDDPELPRLMIDVSIAEGKVKVKQMRASPDYGCAALCAEAPF